MLVKTYIFFRFVFSDIRTCSSWENMKLLQDSSKRMHYSCRNLTRSCMNRFILTSFFRDFHVSYKILAGIALRSQCFFIAQYVSDTFHCCKILARCLARSCKRMHYSCRNLTRSCMNRFILRSFFRDFDVSYKILAGIALSSQCFLQYVSDTFLSFPLQDCSENVAVNSEPGFFNKV